MRKHSLVRWGKGFPENEFETDAYLSQYDIQWREPSLTIHVDHFEKPDSIFILDKHLTVKSAIEAPWLYGPEAVIITDSILFTIGHGNTYFDYGLLKSENRITHQGPLTYDIKLEDVTISQYDSVVLHGPILHYSIPELTATITNSCDYIIQHAAIAYGGPHTRHCGDSIWTRNIENMNLEPGQTKSFAVHDVFVRHYYKSDYPECFYLLRPDNHKDDFADDNQFCKELSLLPITPDPSPIHHYPTVIAESIRFYSPDEIDFILRIFTLEGVSVFAGQVNTYSNPSVDLTHLLPGMYVFQYTIPALGKIYSEKMIKPY